MTDKLIVITILLFIASLVSERLSNMLKIYLPQRQGGQNGRGKKFMLRNLKQKEGDPEKEKQREGRIQIVSVICGIVTAFVLNIDLLEVFQKIEEYKMSALIGWSEENQWETCGGNGCILLTVLGIVITGFFLSFGSKFWHDLLDLLFYTKAMKEKLLGSGPHGRITPQEEEGYISLSNHDIFLKGIAQYREQFKDRANIFSVTHSKMLTNGLMTDCIQVHLLDNNEEGLPDRFTIHLSLGRTIVVPVDYIGEQDIPVASSGPGHTVSPESNPTYNGSICCRIENTITLNRYLLTCSHVITGGWSTNYFGHMDNPIRIKIEGNVDGTCDFAVRNSELDVALIVPDDNDQYHSPVAFKSEARVLVKNDILQMRVKSIGRTGSQAGVFAGFYDDPNGITIQYLDKSVKMKGLIRFASIHQNNDNTIAYTPISRPTDSGGIIYDTDTNKPVALILAVNKKFTIAIPLSRILSRINSKVV